MNPINKLFPLVATDKFTETRAFYRDRLQLEFSYEMDAYFQVRFSDASGPELAFMTVESGEVGLFRGGLVISIPTPNADRTAAAMEAKGIPLTKPVTDKPWGWRSFVITDPAGVRLDFFHVLPQAPQGDA